MATTIPSSLIDPQARIQEFWSGGSNLPTKFDKQKKKKRQKGKAGRFSINYTLVWSKSNSAIETAFQTIDFSSPLPGVFLPTQTHLTWLLFSNVKFVSDVTVGGGGGSGGPPPRNFLV